MRKTRREEQLDQFWEPGKHPASASEGRKAYYTVTSGREWSREWKHCPTCSLRLQYSGFLTTLLLLILCLLQKSEASYCSRADQILWKSNNGSRFKCLDCPDCPQGLHPSIACGSAVKYGTPLHCVPCLAGTYSDTYDGTPCQLCTRCNEGQILLRNCTTTANALCSNCKRGSYEDDMTSDCHRCSRCCRDKKDIVLQECREQGIASDMMCKLRGGPCPGVQKANVAQTTFNTLQKPSQHPTTKLHTRHSITLVGSLNDSVTTSPGTKFRMFTSPGTDKEQTKTHEENKALLIVATVTGVLTFVGVIIAVVYLILQNTTRRCCIPKVHNSGASNSEFNRELQRLTAPDVPPTGETTHTEMVLLKDFEQLQFDIYDKLCTRLEKERKGKFDFDRVGARYELDKDQRSSLHNDFQRQGGSPSRLLMTALETKYPQLTIKHLCETLRTIGLSDVAQLLEPFRYKRCQNNETCRNQE